MGQSLLEFYARPAAMTSAGRYASLFDPLPDDVAALVRVVQGLMVYDVVAGDFYGSPIPEERQDEIHIRPVEQIVARLVSLDRRPLSAPRSVSNRVAGRCRQFAVLLAAMLRAKGVAARARCGFGAYFNPPYFEDHWVCEYWNAAEARWLLADAQLDEVWRAKLQIDWDTLDVARDRFLVAADAWAQCRSGVADASRFGIEFAKLRGLWFVAGNLVRDVAALNKVEMLPWDVWGAQPAPDQTLDDAQLASFDRLAALTRDADASFDDLRVVFATDDGVRVPATVFNAVRNRPETV
jgi:Transglutaminase-like superfamily